MYQINVEIQWISDTVVEKKSYFMNTNLLVLFLHERSK